MAAVRTEITSGGGVWFIGGSIKSSGTTFFGGTINLSGLLVDDVVVVALACDNLSATTPTFDSVTGGDAIFGTWDLVYQGARNASAAAGAAYAMYVTKITATPSSNNNMVTFNISGAVTARAWTLIAVRGADVSEIAIWPSRGGTNGAGTNPGISSDVSVAANNCWVAAIASEQNTVPTGDADTAGGVAYSGVAGTATTGGGSTANMAVAIETKTPTSAVVQTWNPTTANTDWVGSGVIIPQKVLGSAPPPSSTCRIHHRLVR